MAYDDYAVQVENLKRRRQLAQALSEGGGDRIGSVNGVAVPYHWGEGLTQLARGWMSGRAQRKVDEEEKDLRKKRSEDIAAAMSGYDQASRGVINPDRAVPDDQVGRVALDRIATAPDGQLPEPVYGRSEAQDSESRRSEAFRRLALELMPSQDAAEMEYKQRIYGDRSPQGVQSTVVGDDGYYYTVDRLSGGMTNTGVKSAPSLRVVEQEGNTPFGVVTGRGPAGKVVPLGGPSPASGGSMPLAGPVRTPTAGERASDIASAQASVELATKPEITKQTELAKTEAERAAALPGQLADVQKMKRNIEGLLNSPGFSTIYGKSRYVSPSMLPGGDGRNSDARREQLEAQAFGEAIQKMHGLGALSNAEGSKVSAAYTRATNPSISEEDARVAWDEVLAELGKAEMRIMTGKLLRVDAPSAPTQPAAPAGGGGARTFATEAEAEAAGLKPGTRVIIGGVSGTWQ